MQKSAEGIIETDAISAGAHLKVTSTTDKINIKSTIDSNKAGNNGNILLTADKNIATGTINTNGGESFGAVEINANKNGTGIEFVIGGSGNTNGVNGSIITANTTAGGTISTFIHGGVFITNGNASSTAGIKLISMNSIQVSAASSRSGIIELNARNGKLKLPAGSLNADGIGNS